MFAAFFDNLYQRLPIKVGYTTTNGSMVEVQSGLFLLIADEANNRLQRPRFAIGTFALLPMTTQGERFQSHPPEAKFAANEPTVII